MSAEQLQVLSAQTADCVHADAVRPGPSLD